jgi:hypothetical protein
MEAQFRAALRKDEMFDVALGPRLADLLRPFRHAVDQHAANQVVRFVMEHRKAELPPDDGVSPVGTDDQPRTPNGQPAIVLERDRGRLASGNTDVADAAHHLRDQLLPLAERAHRTARESIEAIRRTREGEAVIQLGELVMILDFHRQGLSVSAIARRVGIDRKTVRKYIERGLEPPTYGPRKARARRLERFEAYLRQRVVTYPGLAASRLLREICEADVTSARDLRQTRHQLSSYGVGQELADAADEWNAHDPGAPDIACLLFETKGEIT